MHFDITYEKGRITDAFLDKESNEDDNVLYTYAQSLKVRNVGYDFAAAAKEGDFNDLSDEDYAALLDRIKTVSTLFYDKKAEENVFLLLSRMTRFILCSDLLPETEGLSEDEEDMSGDILSADEYDDSIEISDYEDEWFEDDCDTDRFSDTAFLKDMPEKISNCLYNAGISSKEQLESMSDEELLAIEGIDRKGLKKIRKVTGNKQKP